VQLLRDSGYSGPRQGRQFETVPIRSRRQASSTAASDLYARQRIPPCRRCRILQQPPTFASHSIQKHAARLMRAFSYSQLRLKPLLTPSTVQHWRNPDSLGPNKHLTLILGNLIFSSLGSGSSCLSRKSSTALPPTVLRSDILSITPPQRHRSVK
jgi:hypothetical protein